MKSQSAQIVRDAKNFIMHQNIIRMSSHLNNEDLGRLVRHFFLYAENGLTPDEEQDLTVTVIFNEWRIQFENDKERYEAVSRKRREAGRKRWNKTQDTENAVPVSSTSPTPNDVTDTTPMANDGIDTQGMETMEDSKSEPEAEVKKKENAHLPTVEAKKKGKVTTSRSLETRKTDFYQSILPYVDQYDREMLNDFFQYWTELDKRRQRMRFEMQKTWETSKRLSTWARRESRN